MPETGRCHVFWRRLELGLMMSSHSHGCPRCGNRRVERLCRKGLFIKIYCFVLNVRPYFCDDCGHRLFKRQKGAGQVNFSNIPAITSGCMNINNIWCDVRNMVLDSIPARNITIRIVTMPLNPPRVLVLRVHALEIFISGAAITLGLFVWLSNEGFKFRR
jgi:DNA-directed RNA polymerase subunit RPC12/RpoP